MLDKIKKVALFEVSFIVMPVILVFLFVVFAICVHSGELELGVKTGLIIIAILILR